MHWIVLTVILFHALSMSSQWSRRIRHWSTRYTNDHHGYRRQLLELHRCLIRITPWKTVNRLWVSDFKCSTTAKDFTGSYLCCTSSRCRPNVWKECKIVTLSWEITDRGSNVIGKKWQYSFVDVEFFFNEQLGPRGFFAVSLQFNYSAGNSYRCGRIGNYYPGGSKTTQGVIIYVVKTIETTGGWKLWPWTKLRLMTCGLRPKSPHDAITNTTAIK